MACQYKFNKNDIFHNTLKLHPAYEFYLYNQKIYLNRLGQISGTLNLAEEDNQNNIGHVPTGYVNLYEINVDRPSGNLVYPFVTKQGAPSAFKTISTQEFNSGYNYGDTLTGSYPLSASISKLYHAAGNDRRDVNALKNTFNFYTKLSEHYEYSRETGSLKGSDTGWDKETQELGYVAIPSIMYGSSIKKGSVRLKFFVTGTLIGELSDVHENGELVQVKPVGSPGSGSVAGTVLYNEGFVLLTGSWSLDDSHTEDYGTGATSPKWTFFGNNISGSVTSTNSAFSLAFSGTNYVPTITMFAHAPKGELNHSNNTTYAKHNVNRIYALSSSNFYIEPDNVPVKNIVSSSYHMHSASFEKHTYISQIGVYDENMDLIAIAKLAKPVKKTENREFTFKLKLDI